MILDPYELTHEDYMDIGHRISEVLRVGLKQQTHEISSLNKVAFDMIEPWEHGLNREDEDFLNKQCMA